MIRVTAPIPGPVTPREKELIERARQLSPERQAELVRYAGYVANVLRGGTILTLAEWRRSRPGAPS